MIYTIISKMKNYDMDDGRHPKASFSDSNQRSAINAPNKRDVMSELRNKCFSRLANQRKELIH